MDGLADPLDSFKKIDKLWFDGADLVICAGQSKFRVYRGILSTQSPILRVMLARSTADEDKSQRRGSPYTVLTLPDDAQDVYYFFLAIFDSSFYRESSSFEYPLGVTNSILRLAGKYMVPHLILRTTTHLESIFPEWNRLSGFSSARLIFNVYILGLRSNKTYTRSLQVMDCIDTLPLLVRAGLQWIIPAVMHIVVSRFETSEIIMNPSFHRLPSVYQAQIVEIIASYAMLKHSQYSCIDMLPSANCTDGETCGEVSKDILPNLYDRSRPWKTYDFSLNFKYHLSGLALHEEFGQRRICSDCQAVALTYVDELQKKFDNRYWTVCGLKSPEEAAELREKTIAQLKEGILQFVDFEFEEQSD